MFQARGRVGKFLVIAVAGLLGGSGGWLSAQTPPPGGFDLHQVGLSGPGYQYTLGGQTVPPFTNFASIPPVGELVTPSGQLAGLTGRVNSSGVYLGQDAWFFDGTTNHVIGLIGAGYEYTTASGVFRSGGSQTITNSGLVSGTASRYAADGTSLGYDSWFFNGSTSVAISPTGVGFDQTIPAGTVRKAQAITMDDAGHVIGYSYRIGSDGSDLGLDAWRSDGTSTQIIGLAGSDYQTTLPGGVMRFNTFDSVSPSGKISGATDRFDALGNDIGSDVWLYSGGTSTMINPTSGNFSYTLAGQTYRSSFSSFVNASGQVAATGARYSSAGDYLGIDAWTYNGATTSGPINLTGGVYEYPVTGGSSRVGSSMLIASNGHVMGKSDRFTAAGDDLGSDLWVYDGATTHTINLTGGVYEYTAAGGVYRRAEVSGNAQLINSSGQVAGRSYRFASDGSPLGIDVFFYDGTSSKHVGPTGATYQKTVAGGVERDEGLVRLNDSGMVLGFSARFDGSGNDLGQAGWLFDQASNTTDLLEFSYRDDGYAWTQPQWLTGSGVVLGAYDLFSGPTLTGEHAFWWSKADGFHDLGTLVNGGLGAWANLTEASSSGGTDLNGSPKYLMGFGRLNGTTSNSSSPFLLTPHVVPEPAALALMLPGLALVLRRARSRVS